MVEELVVSKNGVFNFELIHDMNIVDFLLDYFANFYIHKLVPHWYFVLKRYLKLRAPG